MLAVVVNATVVNPTSAGWVRVYQASDDETAVSNLNFAANQTVANLVTMPVWQDGAVTVRVAQATADVVFDIVGYYATSTGTPGSRFRGLTPSRLLDTRSGQPIAAGHTLPVDVAGAGGVPASGATAVALVVTVTEPSGTGWITATPSDVNSVETSSINFTAGQTVSGLVVERLAAGGAIHLTSNSAAAHVVVDVVGFFDEDRSTEAGRFVPIRPTRTFDSRKAVGPLLPGRGIATTWLDHSDSPIPWVGAVVANVTVVRPTSGGWLTAFPADVPAVPFTSTVSFGPGETIANQVMAGASQQAMGSVAGGSLAIVNAFGSTPIVVDVFGFYTNGLAPPPPELAIQARNLSPLYSPMRSATTPLG